MVSKQKLFVHSLPTDYSKTENIFGSPMLDTLFNGLLPIIPEIQYSFITQFAPQNQNVNNSQFYNNEKR